MERKEPPKILGAGLLCEQSIWKEGENFKAEYKRGEKLIYLLEKKDHFYTIHEYLNGKQIAYAKEISLKAALHNIFVNLNKNDNPQVQIIYDEIKKESQGNANFTLNNVPSDAQITFPSGYMFSISQPLYKSEKKYNDGVLKFAEHSSIPTIVQDGIIVRLKSTSIDILEDIIIVNFIVPLSNLKEVAVKYFKSGIIANHQELATIVGEASSTLLNPYSYTIVAKNSGLLIYGMGRITEKSKSKDKILAEMVANLTKLQKKTTNICDD